MSSMLDQAIFDVLTHLVGSAPTSLEETPILAAFRMLDAANHLMALIEENDGLGYDLLLAAARTDYTEHRNLIMTDQVAAQASMTGYLRDFTQEALRRGGD